MLVALAVISRLTALWLMPISVAMSEVVMPVLNRSKQSRCKDDVSLLEVTAMND